jgi:hypothetical protein
VGDISIINMQSKGSNKKGFAAAMPNPVAVKKTSAIVTPVVAVPAASKQNVSEVRTSTALKSHI